MYRHPAPPNTPQVPPEVLEYEQQLIRRARRKKIIGGLVIGLLLTVGLGSCFGPIGVSIASDAWHSRKTKLTPDEQRRVAELLDPIEANARKSQAAFEAVWPRIRGSEIGARRDLGGCKVDVPGPTLRTKDASRSLADSSQASGWTFIDLTPPDRRSPIEHLKMPSGSIALGNYAGADRYELPPRPLKSAAPEKAPQLESTAIGPRAAELRAESAKGIRADSHAEYMRRVATFAEDGLGIDVVVFLDLWEDPKMTSEMAPMPPPPRDDYEAFTRPAPKPTRIFESGFAIAHAIAWNPEKQEVACASQALALSSEHITFKSNDLAPLQQDLVLELERALNRNFVAVGDAPPKLERPALTAAVEDAGAPDAGAPKKPKKRK
jgi:hypothetical protein